MDLNLIIIVVVALVGITAAYKLIPHRRVGDRKPLLALLPKYKKSISLNISEEQLESKLATYGFKKSGSKVGFSYFERGSLLGDFSFSVKLMKVKLGVKEPHDGLSEVTLQASWVVAFDTGDFWTLITELANKLENA